MTRPPDKRRRKPTPEEQALWDRVVRDVERFAADRRDAADDTADAPSSKAAPAAQRPRLRPRLPEVMPPPAPPLSHDRAPGLERRDSQRLRRGKVEIEARLDLHGMTQRAAEQALVAFLSQARQQGKRSVLVITGKGGRGDAGEGVLKRMVPHWLNGPALRGHVRGFSYAAPKHGGEGALYVLLKRRRP